VVRAGPFARDEDGHHPLVRGECGIQRGVVRDPQIAPEPMNRDAHRLFSGFGADQHRCGHFNFFRGFIRARDEAEKLAEAAVHVGAVHRIARERERGIVANLNVPVCADALVFGCLGRRARGADEPEGCHRKQERDDGDGGEECVFYGLGVGVMARSISRVIDWNAASFSGPVTCVTIRPRRFMT